MSGSASVHAIPDVPPLRRPVRTAADTNARTLLDNFAEFANIRSDYILYYDGYRSWSYSYEEIAAASRAFAEHLREASVGKRDKVLIWSESRPEWIAAFWGCVLNGTVVVPVDHRASSAVLANTQKVVGARLVLIGDDVHVPATGFEIPLWRLSDLDLHATSPLMPEEISPDDTAELVFTSGSTAAPKGVVITHRNVEADLAPIQREVMKYRPYLRPLFPLRFLNLLPLSHMFGQALAMFFPPMIPGVVVLMRGYSPQEIIWQIRRGRISFLVCVPKILELMRQYVVHRFPETANPEVDSHWVMRWWRYRRVHRMFGFKFWSFVVGGAPLEPSLEEFWSRLGFLVVQGYGLTETAPIVTFSHPFHGHPIGSAGKPLPGVDVRVDSDGEILVRGDIVTPGYFNAPAESMKAFENGWFHTGDIGKFDENGHLFVRGRKKEMIVTPEGLKVFPEDVELVINAIPGVRDCAVVGRDRVHAVLMLDPAADKEEVVRLANARLEAHQMVRSASVWTDSNLPRTEGTGKLKRSAIQKWVDAGSPATGTRPKDELSEIVGRYAPDRAITPETTLDQLGLSSLERVELLIELEQQFNTSIDEASFTGAHTVADLLRILRAPASSSDEPLAPITWTRTAAARAIRRAGLAAVAMPVIRFCARLTVEGIENLESLETPVIFAANHQSHLDTPAIFAALPPRWRYRIAPAMLKEFFDAHFHPEHYPVWQRLAAGLSYFCAELFFNGFPLAQQEASTRQALRNIGDLISDNWSVLIFPEGERTQTGDIKTFQPGAAMVASRLRLPVIPTRLRGLDKILHRDAWTIHPGPASVTFGPPLHLRGDDYLILAQNIERAVREL